MKLKIIDIASHRNGVTAARFDVVLFQEPVREDSRKVAILFDEPGCCAVLAVDKLAAGDVAFSSNSWRGDDYEHSLREAIRTRSITIDQLADEALEAFWQVIVRCFPQVATGDLSIGSTLQLKRVAQEAIQEWIHTNLPATSDDRSQP